jgi:DNA-directed RNA polymerase specialized sigma24 family protein
MDWNKLKAGDDDAWTDASEELLPFAKRAIRGQWPGLSDDEVNIAANAALHEMIDGIEDIPAEKDLWGRLFDCAKFRARDQDRKKNRKREFLSKADSIDADQELGHNPVDERTRSAREELEYIELRTVVFHILQEYDLLNIELLSEYYFQGLTPRQICEKRGWDPGNFKNRLDQLLHRVHKRLCSDERFKDFCSSFP